VIVTNLVNTNGLFALVDAPATAGQRFYKALLVFQALLIAQRIDRVQVGGFERGVGAENDAYD
jgi:hypothetical protein